LLRIVFSLILLLLIFSQVDLANVLSVLRSADLSLIALSIVSLQISALIRTYRWWLLIPQRVPFRHALRLVYMGEFISGALPTGYAGDIARIVEFEGNIPKATTAGVVLLDRILGFTGLLIVALLATIVGYRSLPSEAAIAVLTISSLGLIIVVITLQGGVTVRLMRLLPKRFREVGDRWLVPFNEGVSGRDISELIIAIALSILNTVFSVVTHYTVALSVGVSLGIGLFFIFAPVVNLSLLLPTLNGLGLREIGYQLLLTPHAVLPSIAVALGIGLFVSRLSTTIIGGITLLFWRSRR
jgi:uncharacterized protein (TIRG00374 family)